jgi:hypothetical protein
MLLALLPDSACRTDAGSADTADFTEADQQIIRRIQARLRGNKE